MPMDLVSIRAVLLNRPKSVKIRQRKTVIPSSKNCSLMRARASHGITVTAGLISSLETGDFLILFPLSLKDLKTSPWVFPVASRVSLI